MSYYTLSAAQRTANDRKAREDAAATRAKGHVSVRTGADVAHERYLRSMGL